MVAPFPFFGHGCAGGDADACLRADLARFKNVKLWSRGVDAELLNPRTKVDLPWPRPIFLTVGRVAIEKNSNISRARSTWHKAYCGRWTGTRSAGEEISGRGISWIQRDGALVGIYAAADVFVFPSRTDTFGLVLLEALASGVPIAAFPASAPRDVIGDTNVGVLDEDLRRACLGALECSRNDCRQFSLSLTWSACARTFIELVTQALKSSEAKTASSQTAPPIPA